jgi:lipopolysaccharide/colanic/teichoic acid biosynthesis glycosyltransferase
MSIVGPRPMIESIVDRMHPHHQIHRHSVRPGVTGLWQISEAGSRLVLEATEYDAHYVEVASPRLDLWILWTTLKQCLGGKQIAFAEMPTWIGIAPTVSAATVAPCVNPVAATSNER